ncbi:MAG: MBL fold metallo-hydrolase [Actinobacteria bacterium]|nr:MBL fold metallo-hydrolase [Actinomycetota bacterium]
MGAGVFELADGVWQLAPSPGINCWVVRDGDDATLVDTGLSSSAANLVRQLRGVGVRRGDIRRVLLTHSHADHMGAVAPLLRTRVNAEVLAGEADVEAVRTGVQPDADPSTVAGRMWNLLPRSTPFVTPQPVPEAQAIAIGTTIPVAGGLVPVATPGHTPGHVAYHLPARDVVLGGDVVWNFFRLRPAPTMTCWRVEANHDSILRLADLAPGTLALAHGSPVDDDPAGRLRQLVADHA